jgi:hypothetical protein
MPGLKPIHELAPASKQVSSKPKQPLTVKVTFTIVGNGGGEVTQIMYTCK